MDTSYGRINSDGAVPPWWGIGIMECYISVTLIL
jgi:hypothetical protein